MNTREGVIITPSASIGVVYSGIDIAQVNFAHEAIDLCYRKEGHEGRKREGNERRRTLSCREKLANLD